MEKRKRRRPNLTEFAAKKQKQSVRSWQSLHKRIYLTNQVFEQWSLLKATGTFSSDSVLASHLISLEFRRRDRYKYCAAGSDNKRDDAKPRKNKLKNQAWNRRCSTPKKEIEQEPRTHQSPILTRDQEIASDDTLIVDIENISVSIDKTGNVTILNSDSESDDGSDAISISSTVSGDIASFEDDNKWYVKEAVDQINAFEDGDDDSTISIGVDDTNDLANWVKEQNDLDDIQYQSDEEDDVQLNEDTDEEFVIITDDAESSVSRLDDLSMTLESQECTSFAHVGVQTSTLPPVISRPIYQPTFGPHDFFSMPWKEDDYPEELAVINDKKVLISVDLLKQLFQGVCGVNGCLLEKKVDVTFCGTSATVTYECTSKHRGQFCTSNKVRGLIANNIQVMSAILISGNNYSKIEKLCKFAGINLFCKSTFTKYQSKYMVPVIEEWWKCLTDEIKLNIKEPCKLAGDGQCDSPGFSAKYLSYYLQDMDTDLIVHAEVLDKRMTGGNSTAMERVALNQSLQKLKNDIPIRELTTDASSTIIKDMRKNHQEINHTLDIWHKSKNLRKALLKVGKKRSLHKIRLWAHEIVNHFWFICQSCNPGGDLTDMEALEKLKSDWLGVLHHVCNEHEWVGGACKHQIIDNHELPWFKETDGDYKALQQIVLDPKFLNSLQYYTRFRHTGKLECINNLSLAYASKRIAFGFDAFKARKCLAAIDWNSHLNRSPAVNKKTGKFLVTRKYNPRTNNWTIKKLFNEKDYPYVPMMIAKILRKRISEYGELNKKIVLKESDPRKIAATIGKSPPEPTAEIAKRYVSRLDFAKK